MNPTRIIHASFKIAAIAIAIIGIAAPAYADGQVQNAMNLWNGDLKNAYSATITSLSTGKRQQGKADIDTLVEDLKEMREMTDAIAGAANDLAPELGLNWADTNRAIQDFEEVATELAPTVTKKTPDLSELQSAKAYADSAIPKALEETRKFGQKYGVLMETVEKAKQTLEGDLSGTFDATVDYLVDGNVDDGAVAAKLLKERTGNLWTHVLDADGKAKDLARKLFDFWKPTYDACGEYQVDAGIVVGALIEDREYNTALQNMQESFEKLKDSMSDSYEEILEFGNELVKITDDWR
jgi:hypothetical protein